MTRPTAATPPSPITARTAARTGWSAWVAGGLGLAVAALLAAWLARPVRAPGPAVVPAPATGAVVPTNAPATPEAAPAPPPRQPDRAAIAAGQWSRLPPSAQEVLSPLQDDWAELSPDQRLKWYDLARRYYALLPDEQQRIQARMAEWARMTPAERGVARLNFQEIRQLSHRERLERWEAYQGLEADERRQLAERGQALTQAAAAPRRSESMAPVPKSSSVAGEAVANTASAARPVGATIVQAPLGSTTVLVSRLPSAAAVSTPGPKIAATSEFVVRSTLLPQPKAVEEPGATPATPATAAPTPAAVPATAPADAASSPVSADPPAPPSGS